VPSLGDYNTQDNSAYEIEGSQILTIFNAPLKIRYIQDVTDPGRFDALFVEALAAKLAYEACEEITQSLSKRQQAGEDYKQAIRDATMTGLVGYKDGTGAIKSPHHNGTDGVWASLKYEGGVHRVQRVPVTESSGRIHTSAAGVLVMPEADPVDVTIDPSDLRIDVFRSSGPGGQSVNTTDSAVRITHLPTGIVVSVQNEKSQLQNKEQAMRILRARLLAQAEADAEAQAAAERRSQVRTVDRSQRVRTYNFPENRVSDHRVGYKAHNLDHVLDGDLDAVIKALVEGDRSSR